MALKPGDIARVKISGENVFVYKLNENGNLTIVRLVNNEYQEEVVDPGFLETVEQNINREYNEAVYRTKLMRAGMALQQSEAVELDEDEPEEPLN